ncbi:hypothetical protein CJF42_03500 [Pseudoalteromonas sp. NBT06-2]|uniref:hypothetical protein n=1 Tax=Pseudoalteromonas sp. NBT06-2 TaxID=2025950 RepID=UPI000BA55A06|nr:hypothetical protein [Pseudoalteromonas sp. NBT06-2]PAJ75709.1 hypothetical protein CJF42_03500 [Pseudoalteromonas sp. NBT06-2]
MAKQMGRPHLDTIDKMRRAALRQRGHVAELQTVFDVEGDNQAEIDAITGPGIRPKSRATFLQIEKDKFEKMMTNIRVYESEEGLQHISIDAVVDPLLENNTVKSVGRKSKDEFTILDRKLLLAQRKLADTLTEWDEAGADEPAIKKATEKSGQRHGRTPKTYPERILELKKEIIETTTRIAELESKLNNIQVMDRQIRVLQNAKREARKMAKEARNLHGHDSEQATKWEYKEASYATEIKQITARVTRYKRLEDNGWKPHDIERMKLANPAEAALQAQLELVENKIGEIALDTSSKSFIDESKAVEAQEDLQRTEKYLSALKKKQALMREIEKIEAEMKTI